MVCNALLHALRSRHGVKLGSVPRCLTFPYLYPLNPLCMLSQLLPCELACNRLPTSYTEPAPLH